MHIYVNSDLISDLQPTAALYRPSQFTLHCGRRIADSDPPRAADGSLILKRRLPVADSLVAYTRACVYKLLAITCVCKIKEYDSETAV